MADEKSTWELRDEAQADMYARIPRGRWGLVGVDSFDQSPRDAGADLYLIGIFDSREEAEAAQQAREDADSSCEIPDRYYVYEGRG